MYSYQTPAKTFAPGMGVAVAERTVARILPNGVREVWADVAERVATGNSMLVTGTRDDHEFDTMHHHLRQASLLMSGRHLQHGDATQYTRPQEVFTNCSTSASSFLSFYLLLNGSGVGRSYDDDMMIVDWCRNMPNVYVTIDDEHKDVLSREITNYVPKSLIAQYPHRHTLFTVPDSREGWAKAIEQIERMTWAGSHAETNLVLDFSIVRPRNAPIAGMQNRPASGPAPLMLAVQEIAALKGQDMAPWKSTMHVDHAIANCVLVGGARRAARMATKTWRDLTALEFVSVKKGGILWSSNNSVTVDEEFWDAVREVEALSGAHSLTVAQLRDEGLITYVEAHAAVMFEAITNASYHDGTGEPGLINVDMLTMKNRDLKSLFAGDYAESTRFKLDVATKEMTAQLAKIFSKKRFTMIVNPCGEIPLIMLGAYCVIADVVPYFAYSQVRAAIKRQDLMDFDLEAWDADAEGAFRTAARALIRTNLMDCLYAKEVKRTNRIGVGITGLHEYAWARFGYGFRDLIDEAKSLDFWKMLARFSNATVDEAIEYAQKLGVNIPHTITTIKPAGTTSKLFGLTEGAHLPSMREYLRWVQFRSDDPLIEEYRAKGYPIRELKSYSGTTIVGFPTVPEICTLGMGDKLVTAAEATPEEQYQYLRLMEKYWLHGGNMHDFAGQVSYTLKINLEKVSYEHYRKTLIEGQSSVKCCSVMPQADTSAYEYQPEQPVSHDEFLLIVAGIKDSGPVQEDVDFAHIDCGSGGCPVDFSK